MARKSLHGACMTRQHPSVAAALFVALTLAGSPARTQGAGAPSRDALHEAIAQFDSGHYADAKTQLTAYARANPRSGEAAFYLGRIALVEGDFGEAAKRLEGAVKLDARRPAYHRWLARAYAQQALRGSKLKALVLAGRIRQHFETAVALDSNDVDARLDLLGYYVTAPGVAGGSEERAEAQAREIAARSAYRGHIATALVNEKRHADVAEREYKAAIAAFPDSTEASYALGLLYQRLDRTDQAFATFEQLLHAHPEATNALYAIGRLAAQTGQRLDRGEQALKKYLGEPPREGFPPLSSAHYRLGAIYERTGRKELARQEYEESLRLEERGEVREALERLR